MTPPTHTTPWGYADHVREIAPGIIEYSTPSHGGIYLSAELLEAMPSKFRSFTPWAGDGWYEEDCDWAIAVVSFPEIFSTDRVELAKSYLKVNSAYYLKRGADVPALF